jgi:ABC-type transporter Mla MlaB component
MSGDRFDSLYSMMDTVVLLVTGPIARSQLPKLCERVRSLLEGSRAELIVCDVGPMEPPDAETVEAMARLQLTALRLGRRVRFVDASGELKDLLAFSGLTEVVPCDELPLESGR